MTRPIYAAGPGKMSDWVAAVGRVGQHAAVPIWSKPRFITAVVVEVVVVIVLVVSYHGWWPHVDWTKPAPINVAEVNATIISILLATIALYFGHILSTKAELRRELFEAAEEIRDVRPPRPWQEGPQDFPNGYHRYTPDEEWIDRLKLLLRLTHGNRIMDETDPNMVVESVTTDDERGHHMLLNMNWLVRNYPVRPPPGGETAAFVREDVLRRWLSDAEELLERLEFIDLERAARYDSAWADAMNLGYQRLSTLQGLDIVDHEEVPSVYFKEFNEILEEFVPVLKRTRRSLRHYDWYDSHTVEISQMITLTVVTVFMLFLGAVLPMLIEALPRLISLWIPSIFYLGIALLGWRLISVAGRRSG